MSGFVSADFDVYFAKELERAGLTDSYSSSDIFLSRSDLAEGPFAEEYLDRAMATLDASILETIYSEYIRAFDLRDFLESLPIPIHSTEASQGVGRKALRLRVAS